MKPNLRSVPLLLAALSLCGSWATPAAPSSEREWLTAQTRELLQGCKVPVSGGGAIYTPDGKGNYRALWTRDFAYMAENAGDLMPLADVKFCVEYLIRGVRDDGATPDRVRPDGVPVYTAGPENSPMGQPNIDNAQFLVIAADACLKRHGRKEAKVLFKAWSPTLDKAMHWIPRSGPGLVWNDPARPHSPYGFTDTVAKTGDLLFESLLYWRACCLMEHWHGETGNSRQARHYRQAAKSIQNALEVLWDPERGAYLAATRDCRQVDIWGNAYAIWLDFPLGKHRRQVLEYLSRNRGEFLWHGQVRHLPRGEYWQRLFTPVERERYQNGAYWATASGWMIYALAKSDPKGAQQLWRELLEDFRSGGICECVNEGYRQLPSYVVSACNPLAAAHRLRYGK